MTIPVTPDMRVAIANVMEHGLKDTLESIEYALIREVLKVEGGHKTHTAATLGLSREGLWRARLRLGMTVKSNGGDYPTGWKQKKGQPSAPTSK